MKLSIIMPVYNCEDFLPDSLESLLRQNVDDYEIILVNDGSTDSSQSIIDSYVSQYPQIIKTILLDNGGQGRARNFALDIAEGEYIGFADADDYVDGTMFQKLLDVARKEDSDIVVCDFCRFTGDERQYEKAALQDNVLSFSGAVWNKIFRKTLVDGIRFPCGLWYEDLEFSAIALLKAKKISYIEEPLYFYRNDNPSTMRNRNSRKNLDIIEVFEHIEAALSADQREDFNFLLINHVLLDSIKRVNLIGDREVIGTLRQYVKKKIPNLSKCSSYRAESRNRRFIMMLNYIGLDNLAMSILKVK